MTGARDEILARIGTALQDRPAPAEVVRDYHGAGDLAVDDVVALFAERVADYRATVTRCVAGDVPVTIAARLAARGATTVVVDRGLPPGWLAGLAVVTDSGDLSTDELDAVDAVVTTCSCAIALTGTIVLDHGAGQGRRALTLVPDVHVVVVTVDQIVPNVPDALALLPATGVQTWISGPSATSDIELERVEGVHGPRTLEVIISSADG